MNNKILYILPPASDIGNHRGVNGPEIRVREIIRVWNISEIIPVVFYPKSGRLLEDFKELESKRICILHLYEVPRSFIVTINYLTKILEVCKKERPDIIHSLGPIHFDIYAIIAAKMLNMKSIVTRVSMIREFKNIGIINYIKVRILDFIFVRFADQFIAISNKGMKYWEKELIYIPVTKKHIVYNGVDLKRFSLQSYPESDIVIFGMIAQLTEIKGHIYLLNAIRQLKEEKHNFKVLLIGDGPLRDELEKYVISNKLDDYVTFIGFVNDIEIIIKEFHIMVLSSLKEGVPVSILESMACNRPVISTNVGAIDEIIADGINGFLIPPADSESLKTAMLKFIENKDIIPKMGKQATLTVRKYSLESMRDGYISVYNHCLKLNKS